MSHSAPNLHVKTYKAGDIIFREGDAGHCAYIIEKGEIEIYVHTGGVKKNISTLGAGEIFGEMSILESAPRSASARATQETTLVVISKEQMMDRIKLADPQIGFLVTILLNRLRNNIKEINKHQQNIVETSSKTLKKLNKIKRNHLQMEEGALIEKLKFESELINALQENEFIMHLQSIISIDSEEINGFEALIRWNSPKRGMVRPDLFMGVAEETSLIIPLGQWVLRNACAEFAKVKASIAETEPKRKLFISINVSGKQLGDPDFFKVLEETLVKHQLHPSEIKLEITESILVVGDQVNAWVKECQTRGLTVALDDFGTGYSSLSYLNRFHFDNIKIDKSFTQSMNKDRKTLVIVRSIIEMAKGLGIPVIAEGVETKDQYMSLKALGCDFGQGYLYSKPVPVQDAILLLKPGKKSA